MNTPDAPIENQQTKIENPAKSALWRRALMWYFIAMLGVGLTLASSFPPNAVPFFLPIAIALMLRCLRLVSPREAFYLGFACGMAWFATSLYWFTSIFSQGAITLWAIASVYPALFCALYVYLRDRLPRFPLPLLAAILWTAVEYFRSELTWPNFGFFGLGYALVEAPFSPGQVPFLSRLASVVGSYGVSFLIVLIGGCLTRRTTPRFNIALFLIWILILLIPYSADPPRRPITVHLVQAMSEDEEALFRLSKPPADIRPDVILWPEYSFVHDPRKDRLRLWPQLQNVARENHCYFIFGAKQQDDPTDDAKFRNTAFLLDSNGDIIGTHVKNHPIHFIRDGSAGTEAKAHPTALGKLGIAICFDLDFPDVTRRLVQDGSEVLLIPSDNPSEWGDVQHAQHRQMFQMRAIECGRWIASSDVAGNTVVIAPNGAEAARVRTSGEESLTSQVGRETGQTLYVRGGWRFGQVCLLGLVVLLTLSFRRLKGSAVAIAGH